MENGFSTRRFLPSTSMLLAFDMAARTGSFTSAARELNLTQGAVSKQIIALEELLGVELFERAHHTVTLTDAGRTYAKEIRAALDQILSATMRAIAHPGGGTLNLAVLPTFVVLGLQPTLRIRSPAPDFVLGQDVSLGELPVVDVRRVADVGRVPTRSRDLGGPARPVGSW